MLALFSAFPVFASFQVALETFFLYSLIPEGIARPVLKTVTQFATQATRLGALGLLGVVMTALALMPGEEVHVVEGVSSADGQPLAAFRSVFPARISGLPEALRAGASITGALAACGVSDYTRASTRLTAKAAKPMLALRLRVAEGSPILRAVAINVDGQGRPVEYGTTWFAGDRVTLTVGQD